MFDIGFNAHPSHPSIPPSVAYILIFLFCFSIRTHDLISPAFRILGWVTHLSLPLPLAGVGACSRAGGPPVAPLCSLCFPAAAITWGRNHSAHRTGRVAGLPAGVINRGWF
ncbi:unnamed protein product [Ectocarpus sp. 6 AP-2014]